MVAIPLLSGIAATNQAEFVATYPLNLEPLVIDSKISRGQLRATSGAVLIGTGPGHDRGGIAWNNECYRVMGTKLVRVTAAGETTVIGDVGGSGPVGLDYSFDRLGIRSGTALWLFDGVNLTQVTDEDLGVVIDAIWIDGFWMTTDGTYVPVTELSDPFQVLPLKYGSAEEDPDQITGLIKVRGEAYVLNRHTIQVFRNVGGNGFPFQTVRGATIPLGCVSPSAKCLFAGTFAFVGGARNEGLGVHVAGQGAADKISTRVIDDALAAVADPTSIILESRSWRDEQRLLVHLPGETWIFCAKAALTAQQPVWYRAQSGNGAYRIRNAVSVYGKTIVGDLDSPAIGELTDDTDLHFGEEVPWSFDAGLIYNEGRGGLVHAVELVGLPARAASEESAFLSMTRDGQTFSTPRAISMGRPGERRKRLQWRTGGARFSNYLGLRFNGRGGMPGFARCEAEIEPLSA